MKHVCCTVASENHAAQVGVLAKSLRGKEPDVEFWWLVVDRKRDFVPPPSWQVRVLHVEDLGIPHWEFFAFVYTIVEWNSNLKGVWIQWLFRKTQADIVTYFDSDIRIYSNLGVIRERHTHSDVLVTPHTLSPIPADFPYEDRLFLKAGVFNLGFISFLRSETSFSLLSWWQRVCLEQGFNESAVGLSVDQKWANLLPTFSSGVEIVRDPSWNVAYWNLFERPLSRVSGLWYVKEKHPLLFFHFSGYNPKDTALLTKHSPGFTSQAFGLERLCEGYGIIYTEAQKELSGVRTDYSFGHFSSGRPIPFLARRLALGFRMSQPADWNPFKDEGAWSALLSRAGCQEKAVPAISVPGSPKALDRNDRRLRWVNGILRMAARCLGAYRYDLLMKYLVHIGNGRNQNYVFLTKEMGRVDFIKAKLEDVKASAASDENSGDAA